MKKIFSLGLMLVALTLMNCSKEEIATEAPAVNGAAFELFAATEDGRTVNDGWSTLWAEGDQINVFHAETGSTVYVNDTPYKDGASHPFTVADTESGRFTGTLQAELTAEAYDWYLFYPYNSYMEEPNDTSSARNYVGSYYTAAQTQTGNNSQAHIAGKYYPLYGKAMNVAADEQPVITMKQASSLVEFIIMNPETAENSITIQSIELTAPESIVGQYAINFAGEKLVFTDLIVNEVTVTSATAKLNVTNGTAIEPGLSAKFYMAVKPHTVSAGDLTIKVTADAGACTKTLEGVTTTFTAGKVKTIGFNYEAPAPTPTETWTRITSVDDLMEGEYVILGQLSDNTTIGYLPNDVVSKNPAFSVTEAFDLTQDENTVSALDNMRWTLSWDATTTRWSIESKEGNYFYGIDDNPGLVVGETTTPSVWEIDSHPSANGTLMLKNNYLRYVGVYTSDTSVSTWRSYTNVLHSNYADGKQSELYLYYCGAIATKTQLATPTVTATAEGNKITVSWDPVTGAGSYTVTCNSQPTQVVTETTAIFTDLGPNTSYTLTVVANPNEINQYTKSEAGTAEATTGALSGDVAAYVQVTAGTLTPGKYLMVYTNDSKSGALNAISTTSTKYGMATDVEITTSGILSTSTIDTYQIEIAESATAGQYTMKFGTSYLYWSSGNSLNKRDSTYDWSITINDEGFAIIVPNTGTTRAILWNNNSPRFACYTTSDKTTIGSVQYYYPTLWKLTE